MEKVWLITGCSTGFGRELALQVLAKGYKVAVASRKTSDVDDLYSESKWIFSLYLFIVRISLMTHILVSSLATRIASSSAIVNRQRTRHSFLLPLCHYRHGRPHLLRKRMNHQSSS